MTDLYVRLQKALDAGVPSGHFERCEWEQGFPCNCQFEEFFRRLVERDRKLLQRHAHEFGQEIGAPPCIEMREVAEFWLTDTEERND